MSDVYVVAELATGFVLMVYGAWIGNLPVTLMGSTFYLSAAYQAIQVQRGGG